MGSDLFVWILIGLLAGVAGGLVSSVRDPGGFVVTILLGIAGALLGGFCGLVLGFARIGTLEPHVGAIVGAVALVAAYRLVMRLRTG